MAPELKAFEAPWRSFVRASVPKWGPRRVAEPWRLAEVDTLDSKELLRSVRVPLFCSSGRDRTFGDTDFWKDCCVTLLV